jgi:Fur family ferric uptake transcriptional regulator
MVPHRETRHSDTTDRLAIERMRAAGLRVTRPRQVVYNLLKELGGHRSAEELLRELKSRGAKLPRASVYNVLNDLVLHGIIMQADAGPGSALYEVGMEWHHHFVCRECGHVIDVPCAVGAKPCLEPGIRGLEVDEAQVIFRGHCPYHAAQSSADTDLPPPPRACRHQPIRS